jgi:hypothetical protein
MKYPRIVIISLSLAVFLPVSVSGGELAHSFINTDFGGNPLTSSYQLNNAIAQNGHKAQPTPATTTTATTASAGGSAAASQTSGDQFAQQLDRLVINALANRLVDKAVGGSTSTSTGVKTFNTGLNQVTVDDSGGTTQVTIIDNKTGGKTVVEIPNF